MADSRIRVGMPASLWLQEFGSQVWAAFGETPYLVGSCLKSGERQPFDVDVRLILSDEEYERWGFGDPSPSAQHRSERWVAMVLAFSALGRQMTGLPIDFQIQQQSQANKEFSGADGHPRSALGLVPLRWKEAHT